MSSHRYIRGLSVVEIIVSAAIIATAVTGIAGAWQLYLKVANSSSRYAEAALLTEEADEALTIMRDTGWSTKISPLSLNTTYYLYWDGSTYSGTTTVQTIQNTYVRTIVFSAVKRDSSDNISTSGTTDANTRDVIITVFPSGNASTTLARTEMLIHNVYNN
ncbi:MAG TPA: hypothetical protein VL335_01515 [Candidatus Paceibacterota bacterium]|jgi:Tfp pilus assembly protein PilV|nr:hypothetical protein [Candidatus Paceibacterota bacterium]